VREAYGGDPEIAREAGRALDALRPAKPFDQENLSRVSAYQPLPGRLESKRQQWRPQGWQNRMILAAKTQETRERIAVLALTGCRPAELAKGVRVEMKDDRLSFTIEGAKKHGKIAGRDREITVHREACPAAVKEALRVFDGRSGVQWVRTKTLPLSAPGTTRGGIQGELEDSADDRVPGQEIAEKMAILALVGSKKVDFFAESKRRKPGKGDGQGPQERPPSGAGGAKRARGESSKSAYEGLAREIRRTAKAAGLDVSAYAFRHDFATECRRAGEEKEAIAEKMGHKSARSQEAYGRHK